MADERFYVYENARVVAWGNVDVDEPRQPELLRKIGASFESFADAAANPHRIGPIRSSTPFRMIASTG